MVLIIKVENKFYYEIYNYIFKHYYQDVIYPKGAWVPRVKPKDSIVKVKSLKKNEERCWIERREYSYKTLRMEEKEKTWITEKEFESQKSALQILEEHGILYTT